MGCAFPYNLRIRRNRSFLSLWYMRIDLNHFISIKMSHDNLGSEISNFLIQLQAITISERDRTNLMLQKSKFLKKFFKDCSSLPFINSWLKKLSKMQNYLF